jgi:general L-amino acid transport system permease protein
MAQEVQRPDQRVSPLIWLRENLFDSWYNSLLTLLSLYILYRVLPPFAAWLLAANWEPILARPLLYFVGQYPSGELWRVAVAVLLVSLSFGLSWGTWGGPSRTFALALMAGFALGAFLPVSLETIGLPLRLFLAVNVPVVVGGFALGQTRLGQGRWVILVAFLSFVVIIALLRGLENNSTVPMVQTTR